MNWANSNVCTSLTGKLESSAKSGIPAAPRHWYDGSLTVATFALMLLDILSCHVIVQTRHEYQSYIYEY